MILISPFARPLRNGKTNAKNYPWWNAVTSLLRGAGLRTLQVGLSSEFGIGADSRQDDMSLAALEQLGWDAVTWASVDNFFPHFANVRLPGLRGVAVYGPSDPEIFGYRHNVNLLRGRDWLRPDPWRWWEDLEHDPTRFVAPDVVAGAIAKLAS